MTIMSIDWNAIFNWPGITLCTSVISGAICYSVREIQHKRLARFDIALSKIYHELEKYIHAATLVRNNINTMPLDYLTEHQAKEIDNWITLPIFELQNVSLQIGMFFDKSDRVCLKQLVDAALQFKLETHKAFGMGMTKSEQLNVYDRARVNFNNIYELAMSSLVELVHARLLGKWQTSVHSNPKGDRHPPTRTKQKSNQ